MAERTDGVSEVLARLRDLAVVEGDPDLLGEHARWAHRFELVAKLAGATA